jgi:hypothetical protein
MANEVSSTVETTVQTVNASKEAIINSFTEVFTQIIGIAPKVLGMVVVIFFGFIIAKFVAKIVTKLSEKIGLQLAAERSGLATSMSAMGIRRNVPNIVGAIIFWLLISVFLMAGFSILGLDSVTQAMQRIVNYIPLLLVATVVVVIGLLVAQFLRGVIATSADRLGISYAEHLANGCYYVLAALTFVAAFDQLNIKFALLENLILMTFGALAVGFGLALGLGGRDVMAGILSGYYVRQRLQSGDHVTVGHMEGTVREVGPVATIIETDEDGFLNRHSVQNIKMLNEAVR